MNSAPRLLVVDDHDESRAMLESALSIGGYDCALAAGPEQALALCAGERFDCMLLDEVLGEDSGLALADRLHAMPDHRPRRILMVSGLAPDFFALALRDGVIDGFIEKPVGLGELLDGVQAALQRG